MEVNATHHIEYFAFPLGNVFMCVDCKGWKDETLTAVFIGETYLLRVQTTFESHLKQFFLPPFKYPSLFGPRFKFI